MPQTALPWIVPYGKLEYKPVFREEMKSMICKIRKWELSDAADLAAVISNKNKQDNLRDGLPYP